MVVESSRHHEAGTAERGADQLVGEEVVGVVVPEESERLRGAVDHHEPEADEADDDDHQPAVDTGSGSGPIRRRERAGHPGPSPPAPLSCQGAGQLAGLRSPSGVAHRVGRDARDDLPESAAAILEVDELVEALVPGRKQHHIAGSQ